REKAEGGGVVTGSGAAFLVLESRRHAETRGREAYAAIDKVASSRDRRKDGSLDRTVAEIMQSLPLPGGPLLTISGASGAHAATVAERAALDSRPELAVRGFSTMTGHLKEAQFPFALALAALAVHRKRAYPPFDETEKPLEGAPEAALATTIGYNCFEGAGLVTRA